MIVQGEEDPHKTNNAQGQNVTDLDPRLNLEKYLAPHSDIVALMVLEHQTLVHNRLAKANYETRRALYYEADLNRAFGETAGHRLESTTRRIQNAGDALVDAMLLADEAKLTAPVSGTSGYAEKFAAAGPRDTQGRSLRDLDLQKRLFKYPCSYLIYSEAFDALPQEMLDYVWLRLWEILSAGKAAEKFAHIPQEERQAIVEILRDTKPNLPNYWK
jgi:hypothetical protein